MRVWEVWGHGCECSVSHDITGVWPCHETLSWDPRGVTSEGDHSPGVTRGDICYPLWWCHSGCGALWPQLMGHTGSHALQLHRIGFVLESVMLLGSGVMYGECDGPEPRVRSSSDIWSQVKMFTESRANAHLLHYSSHYQAGLSKVCPVRAMTTFYNNNIPTDPHIACNITTVTTRPSYLYHRVSVSYRGKSCPVNQIVIIAVFASSSSDCFNSLIISNDQSSSRPMNEILAWQHLFVTTIILSVRCGLRKYSNNTGLVVLQSLAKHSASWSASI